MSVWPAAGFKDTELGVCMKLEVGMDRRKFTREFKLEAVKLIRERGVTVATSRAGFRGAWDRDAPMGAGADGGFTADLSGPGADEA